MITVTLFSLSLSLYLTDFVLCTLTATASSQKRWRAVSKQSGEQGRKKGRKKRGGGGETKRWNFKYVYQMDEKTKNGRRKKEEEGMRKM